MSNGSISHHCATLSALAMHYVTAGQGDPIVLLHGFPQSWYEWRDIIPRLAAHFRVIAPDLRGLGDSTRPAGAYDKKTVAADVWELLHGKLGINEFHLVGHDWGGPVAYALAAAHRDAVKRLVMLDVTIPGDGSDVFSTSQGRWHHGFHRTLDLPEALVQGRERIYVTWFLKNFTAHPLAIPQEAIDEYVRIYQEPGALRAGFNYYRAIPQDIEDNQRSITAGKLQMPVLALGGAETFGRGDLVRESMARVAEDVQGGVIEDCGHFIPEEKPQVLLDELLKFLSDEIGPGC